MHGGGSLALSTGSRDLRPRKLKIVISQASFAFFLVRALLGVFYLVAEPASTKGGFAECFPGREACTFRAMTVITLIWALLVKYVLPTDVSAMIGLLGI